MSTSDEAAAFHAEVKKRFEEFVVWSVAHSSGKHTLANADFDDCRKEISKLAERSFDIGERNAAIPEPSEDGPQYVNVSPAPWP
jgi:hypothetical protein